MKAYLFLLIYLLMSAYSSDYSDYSDSSGLGKYRYRWVRVEAWCEDVEVERETSWDYDIYQIIDGVVQDKPIRRLKECNYDLGETYDCYSCWDSDHIDDAPFDCW